MNTQIICESCKQPIPEYDIKEFRAECTGILREAIENFRNESLDPGDLNRLEDLSSYPSMCNDCAEAYHADHKRHGHA